jgi:hypothetical protein
MRNLSGITKNIPTGMKRKPEAGQNKPSAEAPTLFSANKRSKVSFEHNITLDTALVQVEAEEITAENNTNSATTITHTSPLDQAVIKHEEEEYNADTDNEEAPLTVKEEEEIDDEGSQLPPDLEEIIDTLLNGTVIINSGTAPESIQATPAHVKLALITSGVTLEAVKAIPVHVTAVAFHPGIAPEAVKAIPAHVYEVIITSGVAPEAVKAIPVHVAIVEIGSDLAPEAIQAIPKHIRQVRIARNTV